MAIRENEEPIAGVIVRARIVSEIMMMLESII